MCVAYTCWPFGHVVLVQCVLRPGTRRIAMAVCASLAVVSELESTAVTHTEMEEAQSQTNAIGTAIRMQREQCG
jgi:hypothetical protein